MHALFYFADFHRNMYNLQIPMHKIVPHYIGISIILKSRCHFLLEFTSEYVLFNISDVGRSLIWHRIIIILKFRCK